MCRMGRWINKLRGNRHVHDVNGWTKGGRYKHRSNWVCFLFVSLLEKSLDL